MDCSRVRLWYVLIAGPSSPSTKATQESGSAALLHDITSKKQQENYDFLVSQTNCSTASDTLSCLRQAPYQAILSATVETNALLSYESLNITWGPVVDGVILKQTVRESLRAGKYARVG